MKKLSLLLILGASFAEAQTTKSEDNFGSLTPKRYRSSFTTRSARKVGDVLTIIISENSVGQYQAQTQSNKKDSSSSKNSVPLIDWVRVGLLSSLANGSSGASDATFQSQGQSTQQGRLTARMTVMVKQILPTGTIVVEGTRAVKINRDTQQFTLSGICRIEDIRNDNTLLSENLANAEIRSEGIGMIYERQKRGMISRLFDWLF
jgi:flagellar L-ring protein FlgH